MMSKEALRIVFMGTPDFAVPSLQVLVEAGYNIVGVITVPDKPAGRGQKIQQSAVKQYAEAQGLNILQPTNLKNPDFQKELFNLQANLQIVVAFRMLPEAVWSYPEFGTFNLHASLLPNYRGAAPINWAVINGEHVTGCTTFFLKHEIDTGDIIFQEEEEITTEDTAGSLYGRLMHKGAQLVLKTTNAIAQGTVETQQQIWDHTAPIAPKIFRETCQIQWDQPCDKVYNFIRGLAPYPGAWTELNGKTCKLFEVSITYEEPSASPYLTDNKSFLHFNCADGRIKVHSLQLQGKKRMTIDEFLRGNQL